MWYTHISEAEIIRKGVPLAAMANRVGDGPLVSRIFRGRTLPGTGGMAENAQWAVKEFIDVMVGIVAQAGHPGMHSLDGVPSLGSGQGEGFLRRGELGADLCGVEQEVSEPAW